MLGTAWEGPCIGAGGGIRRKWRKEEETGVECGLGGRASHTRGGVRKESFF